MKNSRNYVFKGRTIGRTGHPLETRPPETYRPFFVSKSFDYALSYAQWAKTKNYVDNVEVYLFTLSQTAKFFDGTNPSDLNRLRSLNYWPEEVLKRLAAGADVLMVMGYAAKNELIEKMKGAGARDYRDVFCMHLKKLGYDGFKSEEDVDGIESETWGIITMDGLDLVYPTPIPEEAFLEIRTLSKRNRPLEEILKALK